MLMHTEKWEATYHRAVLEVDRQRMPERIVAARQAMSNRLQDLNGDPDDHGGKTANRGCAESTRRA